MRRKWLLATIVSIAGVVVVALASAVFFGADKAKATGLLAQTWEYTVAYNNYRPATGIDAVLNPGGKVLQTDRAAALNDAGRNGWELVSVYVGEGGDIYFFKRPST